MHLVGTLIALLYNGMSAFQYCEVTFGDINYSILDSLYVVMVTLSTVGYGGKSWQDSYHILAAGILILI